MSSSKHWTAVCLKRNPFQLGSFENHLLWLSKMFLNWSRRAWNCLGRHAHTMSYMSFLPFQVEPFDPLWPSKWTRRVASFLKTRLGHWLHWIFSDSVCFITWWMSSALADLRSFPQVRQEKGFVLAWICLCCCNCCTFEKVWSQDSHRKLRSYSPWVSKCPFNSWLLEKAKWHQLQIQSFAILDFLIDIEESSFISVFCLLSFETSSFSGLSLMAMTGVWVVPSSK